MRRFGGLFLLLLALALGAAGALYLTRPRAVQRPDPPALITRLREVMRLTTLEVRVYKKVTYEPHPLPEGSLWKDVANWAKFSLRKPKGKAIVFAVVHVGFDLSHLDASRLQVQGDAVEVVLPEHQVSVELLPEETEVVGSNLSSQETAQLFQLAKEAFEHEARNDAALAKRARESAERAVKVLLLESGFREVRVVDRLSAPGAG